MRALLILPLLALTAATAPTDRPVTITRDDWGIAHIDGRADADAIFGMIYAQAEDDFPRIEANYLTALGRTAEAEGEQAVWQDLRARLYISDPELKAAYAQSPDWLRKLMDAWADGLNFYLATHPNEHPRVLKRFEPWMALSFIEGSIGGDIERIDLQALEAFYGKARKEAFNRVEPADHEPRGSNGIAIAPSRTVNGHALLLINPHTSFYFRSEQQVTSGEGLNVYGAATWGQFFIYQGWNANAGWMHTSSGVDSVDEFAYDVRTPKGTVPSYRFGKLWRGMTARPVVLRVKGADGRLHERRFLTWRTHRGPIVRSEGGKWIGFAMMNRPVAALEQSYLRTKAKDLASFLGVARRQANSSNNTIFADGKGEIAYLHPQFVPRRSDRFDYRKVVDGSDPASDWGSLHGISELPNVMSPPNGWVTNSNNWPWSVAGAFSPDAKRFPAYMDMWGENPRGLHATAMLSAPGQWLLDRLQAAAYDPAQPGFDILIPRLEQAWTALPKDNSFKGRLGQAVDLLKGWDRRWSLDSEANTLANYWADGLWQRAAAPEWDDSLTIYQKLNQLPPRDLLGQLEEAVKRLTTDFGTWRVKWRDVNRFQRLDASIKGRFDDGAQSIAVPFTSARWGSLASFGAGPKDGSKRWYGNNGNSFVAVVEFGPTVTARAVTAGGASGRAGSPHFADQIQRYSDGNLRPVYFTAEQLKGHVERRYRPGE